MGGGASIDTLDKVQEIGEPKVFGKGTIQIVAANIKTDKTDAVAIPQSSKKLVENILKAAGDESKSEYEKSTSGCNLPFFAINGGKLHCKKIFFLEWWQPKNDPKAFITKLRNIMRETIAQTIACHFSSLTLPVIGFGPNQYPPEFIIKIFVNALQWELLHTDHPLKIRIAVLGENTVSCHLLKSRLAIPYGAKCKVTIDLPSTWVNGQAMDQIRFQVSPKSSEYSDLSAFFNQTINGKCNQLLSIERIQNRKWYIQFITNLEELTKKLGMNPEKRLFHGCSEEAANLIIKSYFNRSFAGVHGVSYGVGAYFSSQANYSHQYTQMNQQNKRHMLVCRVLVGKTIKGTPKMKVPPDGYDSTTDGNHIFVTYYDSQAYAEYLITYT